MVDGAPYSGDSNNGRTVKPLAVDVHRRQHKGGLSGGIIVIITLSVFIAVVLCSAAAWVLLKCKDYSCHLASTPQIFPHSLTNASGNTAVNTSEPGEPLHFAPSDCITLLEL